jgi:hypothetical protein
MHNFVFEFPSSSFVVCCFVFAYFIAKPMILTSPSRIHSSISRESTYSRRHHSTQNPSLTSVPPTSIKRKSLKDNTPINVTNRELAFRQLTEQLWAAGIPSSTTACSMSVRSRCSSAPPSERDGGEDEITKTNWNNDNDDDDNEEAENIDWDEPDVPDEGNSSCLKILAIFHACFAG